MDWIPIIFLFCQLLPAHAETYDYENTGLTQMPNNIPLDATRIILRFNNIPAYPEDAFEGFYQLSTLRLNNNPLSVFPNLIPIGNTLKVLTMQVCLLTTVNATVFNALTALETLLIGDNLLTSFPNVPGPGNSLMVLRMESNSFTEFPVLSEYTSLQRLAISKNYFLSVDDSAVTGMSNLTILRATHVTHLPDNPVALQSLEILDITSATVSVVPLTCPRGPLEVLAKGSGVSLCRCENVWLKAVASQRGPVTLDAMTCGGASTTADILALACSTEAVTFQARVVGIEHEGFLCQFPIHSYHNDTTRLQCTLLCLDTLGCMSFNFLASAEPLGWCVIIAPTDSALTHLPHKHSTEWHYYSLNTY